MRPPIALPRLDTSTISFHLSRRSRTAPTKIEAKGIVIDTVMRSAVIPVMSRYARSGTALHTYSCIVVATRAHKLFYPDQEASVRQEQHICSLLEPLAPMSWTHVHLQLCFEVYPAIPSSQAWKNESMRAIFINNSQVQRSVGRH